MLVLGLLGFWLHRRGYISGELLWLRTHNPALMSEKQIP
jgi:hypothetical protein